LPTSKKTGTTPANKQKGKKICTCCHEERNLTDYYLSYSPMYSLDKRVPVCKDCCKTSVLNNDGTINYGKFKVLLRNIDKPLYYDLLWSAEKSIKNEDGYIDDEALKYRGKDILQKYFTLVVMRQDRARSYQDAENDSFIHQNNNRTAKEKKEIIQKYKPLFENNIDSSIEDISNEEKTKPVKWSKEDKQNMKYAIEVIGYDPFEDYPDENRKFLFNSLSPYLEDDDNVDDAYKLSQILQIIKNNFQIDTCDKKMSQLDPLKDAESIKTLSDIKNKLVQSNDKIAKENEISVKNRSNKDAGKSTLTYLMRDLRERDFDKAEADYYDQLKSEGTRWAVEISQKAILDHCIFDENDKKEIYETQLKLIDDLNQTLDDKKEEIRQLLMKIDELNATIRNLENK
jgi:hypothetical protein